MAFRTAYYDSRVHTYIQLKGVKFNTAQTQSTPPCM